jgi:hypothetical protein
MDQPKSDRRDLYSTKYLPTSRHDIINHPKTLMANLHSDGTSISPVWSKISTTAWDGRAQLCGGYGRRLQVGSSENCSLVKYIPILVYLPISNLLWVYISRWLSIISFKHQNTSISSDAPVYFLDPDRVSQPTNRMDPANASVTRLSKKRDPLAASYVLPGGESIQNAIQNPAPHRYEKNGINSCNVVLLNASLFDL